MKSIFRPRPRLHGLGLGLGLALFVSAACGDDGAGDELPEGAFTTGPGESAGDDVADTTPATDGGTMVVPGTDTLPSDDTGPPQMVSFDAELQPLFTTTCLGPVCHEGTNPLVPLTLVEGGDVDPYVELTTRAHGLSGMPYVTPGDPNASYLYRKLEGTHLEGDLDGLGGGSQMPLSAPALSDANLTLVRDWILTGAME